MKNHCRLFLLSLFVTPIFTINVQAQEAVKDGLWSDPSTWSGGEIPRAVDKVTITDGLDLVVDPRSPELGCLTISRKLRLADNVDLELATEWIMVHGELEIGTEARPHTSNATITLTDNVKDEQLMGMGDRGIMLSGGTLNLHGNRTNTWTQLANTADAGATSIEVRDASQWRVRGEAVPATDGYNRG